MTGAQEHGDGPAGARPAARMADEGPVTAGSTAGPAPAPNTPEPDGPPPGLNLELLVHGVGGTTPAEMLNDPGTQRVTGDGTAAVYRRTEDIDAEERPGDYTDRPIREAYSWANLTSGNGSRALWLILLPFMVVNLAHWTRPASVRRTSVRAHGVVVRLLSLSLTVLLVAAACEVALDLVAWQCAGTPRCVREHSWLGFMGVGADGTGGWWSTPGRRLALAAAVPAALTVLLWWLSHRTWVSYESQPPLQQSVTGNDRGAGEQPALSQPGFWYGKRHVLRLRAAHTAAGFLTIAAELAAAAGHRDHGPDGNALLGALGWTMTVLLTTVAGWVVYVVCSRGRKESRPDDTLERLTVNALPGTAAALMLLTAVYGCLERPGWTSKTAGLPGDGIFGGLALLEGLLVVVLAALGLLLHRERPAPRTVLRGLGAASVAMLACALGNVMSGGVAQRVADWLDGEGTPGMDNGLIPGPPTILTWQASIIPVTLGVVLVLLGWFLHRIRRATSALTGPVEAGYPGSVPDESRSRNIAATIARAGVTDSAPWIVGLLAAVMLLLGTAGVLGTWLTGEVPGRAADGAPAVVDGFADTVQALGSWLMSIGFLLFLASGRLAYTDASARRTIGILWDVGTFWPRAAHPFAPPCYAERAVPDLAWRMATWTRSTGGRLVISGHSQGSVLAAAALWHLDPVTRRQVALLTYGSPLERLYGRWFPAYFGPRQLAALHGELHCWRNLWRLTDPIGGPVRHAGDRFPDDSPSRDIDRGPLLDPLAYERTAEHPLPAPILGHSDYQADPAFDEERDALLHRLRRREPAGAPAAGETALPHQPRQSADGLSGRGTGRSPA